MIHGFRTARKGAKGFRSLTALLLGVVAVLSGCDLFGPSGPGTLPVSVVSPATVGGLVVEVAGPGIEGFEALDGSRVWGNRIPASSNRHRVVVLAPEGISPTFGIRVSDIGESGFAAVVVEATTVDNQRLPPNTVQIQIER